MKENPPDSPEQQNRQPLTDVPEWAENVMNNFTDAVVVVDADGNFLWWNDRALELAGYVGEEFGSMRFEGFFDDNDIDQPKEILRRILEEGEAKARLRVIAKSGRVNTIDVRCKVIEDADGNVIGATGVARDISDQVEAEELVLAQRDLAYKLSGSDDLGEILEWALPAILGNVSLSCGVIHLFDNKTGDLKLLCQRGFLKDFIDSINTFQDGGPAVALIKSGSPLFAQYKDITSILGVRGNPDDLKAIGIIPIVHQEQVLGSLCVASRTEEAIPDRSKSIIQSFLEIIGQGISRIRLADELRASEEKYRLFHEHSGVAILTADLNMVVTDVNPMACELVGRPKEELIGKTLIEAGPIIHPDDLKKSLMAVTKLFEARDAVSHAEIRYLRPDGSIGYAEVSAAILYKENQMVGFTNIIKDVTDRKVTEEVIKHSEEMFRQMFNYMSSGVAIYETSNEGEDFIFKDVNKAAERIDNIERDNVIGKPFTEVFHQREEFGLPRLLKEVWKTGEPIYHPPTLHSDGRIQNWRDYYVYKLPSGEVVAIYDDLTEQRRAEDTIRKNAEDLKNLLDVAAHELRHPIAIFKGYSDMLRNHWKTLDKKAIREALENIETASNRLSNLVTELLDLSRIENNKLELIPSKIRVSSSIKRATEEMRVRGFNNLFSVSIPEDEQEIYADFDKITKVFLLLLDNAIRYAGDGSPVDIWTKQNSNGVMCYIADRGPGIHDSYKEEIFNRFYQVESIMHHSTSGIGLGLYIARSIIESHGGEIGVEPREGGGSVFHFSIPHSITQTKEFVS